MKWYKRDPDAAIAGTAALSFEERGALISVVDLLYSRNANVPDDDAFLSRALNCDIRQWRRLRKTLTAKGKIWRTPAGLLMARRVEVALNESQSFSELQANRVRSRYEKPKIISNNNVTVLPRGTTNTTTTTSTPTKKKENISKTEIARDWVPKEDHFTLGFNLSIGKPEVNSEGAKMRDWALAKGERRKDWDAYFNNWIRRKADSKPKYVVPM